MRLPDSFVKEGLEIAQTLTIFDVPVESLSREELLASVAHGWTAYNRALDESRRGREFMAELAHLRALKETA
jgi:hypothetical protein